MPIIVMVNQVTQSI